MTVCKQLLVGGAALAAAILAGVSADSSRAAAAPTLTLLPPTGPARVGTVSRVIADPARHGKTMIQLFYPTDAHRGRPAPYMPKRTADLAAAQLHEPAQLVETIRTGILAATAPADGAHPVVLFSPGLTELRSDDTAFAGDLASRGYVVVTIDHPTESALVEFPNRRIVPGTFHDSSDAATSTRLRAKAVAARVGDIRAAVAALPAIDRAGLLRGRLDLGRIGMFGFSLGGAATASAIRALPQIRVGVDLDGSLYGAALTEPTTRPFLFVARDDHTDQTDPSWTSAWAQLHGYKRQIHLIGAGHGDFSDAASFLHQLKPDATDPSGYYGPIEPDQATAATRTLLAVFFDRFLRGATSAQLLLDNPSTISPQLAPIQ